MQVQHKEYFHSFHNYEWLQLCHLVTFFIIIPLLVDNHLLHCGSSIDERALIENFIIITNIIIVIIVNVIVIIIVIIDVIIIIIIIITTTVATDSVKFMNLLDLDDHLLFVWDINHGNQLRFFELVPKD